MKKTTYAVIILCICMLLSGCMEEERKDGIVENPETGESKEAGKETAVDEKAEARTEKTGTEPEDESWEDCMDFRGWFSRQ